VLFLSESASLYTRRHPNNFISKGRVLVLMLCGARGQHNSLSADAAFAVGSDPVFARKGSNPTKPAEFSLVRGPSEWAESLR